MSNRRSYLDSNVLIAAWRGNASAKEWVRAVLDDPKRRFVVSDFVRLEVLSKPTFHRQTAEIAFMELLLDFAEQVPTTPALIQRAIRLASQHDLAPLDALHVSAATEAGVDELITLEKPDKPMCRQTEVRAVSLFQFSE
ncbi:MAG: type II toxin-antitoxin system VapC family toxin [Candidatus Competibacteraceae bacterium]|nr:type II toxin-antitoxin system VapC family toxin [Candidatus Competibacteraceae bacterium]